MGRSWTMLRLGPLQVNVRKGLGTEGASPGMGTERMASFTCADARTSLYVFGQHGAFVFLRVGTPHCKPNQGCITPKPHQAACAAPIEKDMP